MAREAVGDVQRPRQLAYRALTYETIPICPRLTPTWKIANLGGGCFWCVEAVFDKLQGVESAVSGYMGGTAADANYEAVCSKGTDHVEIVRVTYDPNVVSLRRHTSDLLHRPRPDDPQSAR